MKNISKSFPGVNALNNVDFDLRKGEIHAIVGENGAGKSVLLNLLNGLYRPDAGTIFFKGCAVEIKDQKAAQRMGIAMIHQELSPIMDMTVADNIFLNHYPRWGCFVDSKRLHRMTNALFERMGMKPISSDRRMRSLDMAQVQIVEIAKALSYDAEVIVMDEPTSALSSIEVDLILALMRKLRAGGVAILFISHKMEEVLQVADRITVMRDGQKIECREAGAVKREDLIIMMSGHKANKSLKRKKFQYDKVRLEVREISCPGYFERISFKLHAGEILGLGGLVGARRTEVAEAIFGLRRIKSGQVLIDDAPVRITSVQDAVRHKIAFATEDRKMYGLFLRLSLSFNISITSLKRLSCFGIIRRKRESELVARQVEKLDIKARDLKVPVEALSGGNQQKVVLAKWLELDADILILDDPTRGIDVGARQELYGLIREFAEKGKAVLLISSDVMELIALSDRVVVMNEGKIRAELAKDEINQENIIRYATQFVKDVQP